MFGLFGGKELELLAARLKEKADAAAVRYLALDRDALTAALARDLPNTSNFHTNAPYCVVFWYLDLPGFQFSISTNAKRILLSVQALTMDFAGFQMVTSDGEKWACSALDGFTARASQRAKKLAAILAKHYGVNDTSRLHKRYGGH